jgi:hypothetical protein
MTMYAKITNGLVDQFPYSVARLKADNPETGFPNKMTVEDLAREGVYPVIGREAPSTGPYEVAYHTGEAVQVDGEWQREWAIKDMFSDTTDGDGVTTAKAEHEAAFLGAAKAAKLDELAAARWNAEESGTTFGGSPLATDRTTQAKLTAGFAKAANDANFVIASWKFAAGVFGALDAGTIIAAANAVEAHIQACFTNEKTLSANVLAAADFAALDAVDLTVGWP